MIAPFKVCGFFFSFEHAGFYSITQRLSRIKCVIAFSLRMTEVEFLDCGVFLNVSKAQLLVNDLESCHSKYCMGNDF